MSTQPNRSGQTADFILDDRKNADVLSIGHPGLDRWVNGIRRGEQIIFDIPAKDDWSVIARWLKQAAAVNQAPIVLVQWGDLEMRADGSSAAKGAGEEDRTQDQPEIRTERLDPNKGPSSVLMQLSALLKTLPAEVWVAFEPLNALTDIWRSDDRLRMFLQVALPAIRSDNRNSVVGICSVTHMEETVDEVFRSAELVLRLNRIPWENDDPWLIQSIRLEDRYSPRHLIPQWINDQACAPLTDQRIWLWLVEQAFQFSEAGAGRQKRTENIQQMVRRLLPGDGTFGTLIERFFDREALQSIQARMIGSGSIGGKAAGMLLARQIIQKEGIIPVASRTGLEDHDSWYIGTDWFEMYIIQNGWWTLLARHRTPEGYSEAAGLLAERIPEGTFSLEMRRRFAEMLEAFGETPVIVRSSSLLEDDYGNAFAGKYESVFCANQGSAAVRLEALEAAIKRVYASMFDPDALSYRSRRGLSMREELMALLVQRVSGDRQGDYFFPQMAGVGHSNNLYVWNERLDASAGMLRLVFGLGTRAVDRVEGDYPRIVALDQPLLSSHETREAERAYTQHYVDLIDLNRNTLMTVPLDQLIRELPDYDWPAVAEIDWIETRRLAELGLGNRRQWLLNFRNALADTEFIDTLRATIHTLEKVYQYPVDIEFTINPEPEADVKSSVASQTMSAPAEKARRRVNLLQCRPLQTRGVGASIAMPAAVPEEKILLEARGHFMGGNVCLNLRYLVSVDPQAYAALSERDRYQVARLVGELNRELFDPDHAPTLLLGPGRWGTTTPSLGVPVSYSEIDNISALGEVSFQTAGMMPELSFGSHFFQDLVEGNIFYLAVLPHIPGNRYRPELMLARSNQFNRLLPQYHDWSKVIGVYDFSGEKLTLLSDITTQRLLCAILR